MPSKRKSPAWTLLLGAVVLSVGCVSSPQGEGASEAPEPTHHHVRMLAVEWKGGTNEATEPYPGAGHMPPGAGYGIKAPDENGRWEVHAYRWDPGVLVVHTGDTVTLDIFGVNGAHHDSEVEGHDVQFNVTRGTFTEVTFVAGPPGTYRITCHTHAPSMDAMLVVLAADGQAQA